ncbi:MAG: hypothetical protein QOF78_118 [Phycisphaerales bacterium]|jgi:hypothetical protein|nr:hypothetical protein [Phycisphaerales bacterium]
MLNWSNTKYKFTFGIGSLAMTAIMAELWKPILPIWVIMVVALLPLVVFVFVHPDEMPAGFVRAAHVFAAVWYVASVAASSVGLCLAPKLPNGWIIFPLFCAMGLIPASLVLSQAVRGRYRVPSEHDDGDSAAR